MPEKYGTLRDVAEMFEIQIDTARKWAKDGYLPAIPLGRNTGKERRRCTWRFDMDEVRQWTENQKQSRRTGEVPVLA